MAELMIATSEKTCILATLKYLELLLVDTLKVCQSKYKYKGVQFIGSIFDANVVNIVTS